MRGARGYSLVELLVVLAIMGLIATVAVPPLIGSIERTTLTADARTLATQLRAWRDTAMDQQTEIALTPLGHRLTASTGDELTLTSGTTVEVVDAKTLVIAPGSGTRGTLRLSRGNASVRVVIDTVTGRITIETTP